MDKTRNRISQIDLEVILEHTKKNLSENFEAGSCIFITGATGFFGKWLLESLLHLNQELGLNAQVSALSRNPEVFLDQFPFFKHVACISWVKGDIKNFKFPEQKFDYIIHAATDADAKLNAENPLLMLDTITEGTKRVLELARMQTGLKSMLLTSSGAVYGKQPENIKLIKETNSFPIDINNPSSAYAEGKRLAELYCAIYAKQFNIPVKIARCFAFVGPYLPLDKHFAIGNFISDVLSNREIVIKGDGTPLRSYMYAADLVVWLLTILLKGEVNKPYNVGSDQAISILDLALLAKSFQKASGEIKVTSQRSNLPREQYIPDISICKKNLNLNVFTSLQESMDKTIRFHLQNQG
jgi:nucleoside-diphosphate-sugar epimerase